MSRKLGDSFEPDTDLTKAEMWAAAGTLAGIIIFIIGYTIYKQIYG